MPGRIVPLVTDEIYHVFNRGIDRRPTFTVRKEYSRAIEAIEFYRIEKPPIRLSQFLSFSPERQNEVLNKLESSGKLVQIFCYCLMPNHFHLLLKQIKNNGISKFLSNYQNSYTRYFNTKHSRDGSLFLDQFKGVRIETDEQLLHVSRYIHLNPYTSFVVKSLAELEQYPWSSFPEYLSDQEGFVDKRFILDFFKNKEAYKQFVFDQADYQRKLDKIKHLIFE